MSINLKLLAQIEADSKHTIDTMGLNVKELSKMDTTPDGNFTLDEFIIAKAKNPLNPLETLAIAGEYSIMEKKFEQIKGELSVRKKYPNLDGKTSKEACQLVKDDLKSPFKTTITEIDAGVALFCRSEDFADVIDTMLKFSSKTSISALSLVKFAPQERVSKLIDAGLASGEWFVKQAALSQVSNEPEGSRLAHLYKVFSTQDIAFIELALEKIIPYLSQAKKWEAFQKTMALTNWETFQNAMAFTNVENSRIYDKLVDLAGGLTSEDLAVFLDKMLDKCIKGQCATVYDGYYSLTRYILNVSDAGARFGLYLKVAKLPGKFEFQPIYNAMTDAGFTVAQKEEILSEFIVNGGRVNYYTFDADGFKKVPESLRGTLVSKAIDIGDDRLLSYNDNWHDILALVPRNELKVIAMKAINKGITILDKLPKDMADELVEYILGNPEKDIPMYPNASVRNTAWNYVFYSDRITWPTFKKYFMLALKDPDVNVRKKAVKIIDERSYKSGAEVVEAKKLLKLAMEDDVLEKYIECREETGWDKIKCESSTD